MRESDENRLIKEARTQNEENSIVKGKIKHEIGLYASIVKMMKWYDEQKNKRKKKRKENEMKKMW